MLHAISERPSHTILTRLLGLSILDRIQEVGGAFGHTESQLGGLLHPTKVLNFRAKSKPLSLRLHAKSRLDPCCYSARATKEGIMRGCRLAVPKVLGLL